jgi:iron complex outermembrane receptor protein
MILLLPLLGVCLTVAAQDSIDNQRHNHYGDSTDVFYRHLKLNEVTVTGVTGETKLKHATAPVSLVSSKELRSTASSNIIDAIALQPGVSQLTTGNGISKPIIRGLGYNRVAVVSDGIRQEGQQWGDEHGIELDAAGVTSVEILKGPASLMYGSDALAGVVVFRSQPVLPQGTMKGNVLTEYQTNNGLLNYSIDFAGHQGSTLWDVRYSEKFAHAYKNKVDGRVPGSQFHERSLSALVGQNRQWGHSHLRLSYYHLTPSIVEGERDETTGELLRDEQVSLLSYRKAAPFQQIRHFKAVWDNAFNLGEGRLNAVVGYQQNRRQEFEEPDEAELDFRLHTVNYDVRYISPELTGRWKLSTGINGMWQQSQNLGEEALIPAYRLLDAGVFATVTRSWDRWNLSGGVRFDHRWLTADDREEQFRHFRKNMNGLSGSVGATYCLTDQMHLRLNLARGFRAPNLSELGSNGVHEGSLRYELGNQQLKPEDSWQLDAGIDYSTHIVTAQLSLFVNHISNFIFLQRMDEGERLKDERLEMNDEGFPVYQYAAGTARLWGGEATVVVHPMRRLHIENTFAYVATRLLHQPDDSRYLPTTPQPRWTATIKCDLLRQCRHLSNSYASIGLECYLRQHHIFAANDTETPSPSYTLLNAAAGTDVMHHGRRLLSVFLTANNLLDRAYQNHLSRLKYADVNTMTGRRGVSNMGRNIGIKVVVPIDF